jgi:hypothetical protein
MADRDLNMEDHPMNMEPSPPTPINPDHLPNPQDEELKTPSADQA